MISGKKIIYIVGAQNSGSTMLEAMLSDVVGSKGLGEVGAIFSANSHDMCVCKAETLSCADCSLIAPLVRDKKNIETLSIIKKEKGFLSLLSNKSARKRYAAVSDEIFGKLLVDREILFDSSKNVSRALALGLESQYEIYFVHLIRDGRGYVKSRNNPARLERTGESRSIFKNIVKWFIKNISATLVLKYMRARHIEIKYEELMNDTSAELMRIADFANIDVGGVVEKIEGRESFKRTHVYEAPRRVDYSEVKIEPSRVSSQRYTKWENLIYILSGGVVGLCWGYGVRQRY
jgi:hypothetical protein